MLAMRLERQNRLSSAARFIARIQAETYFRIAFRPLRSPLLLHWLKQDAHTIHVAQCVRAVAQDVDKSCAMNDDNMSYCCLSLTQRSWRLSTWLPPAFLLSFTRCYPMLRHHRESCIEFIRESAFRKGYLKHLQPN